MKLTPPRASALVVAVAALATVALIPSARSQVQTTPIYAAIGVATTGSSSMVWFHEPATGKVVACQSTGSASGGLSGINCVASKLP